jgi:hypothetical protein
MPKRISPDLIRSKATRHDVVHGVMPLLDCHLPRQFIVSSISFVSTTNTTRSLARCVSPALALTAWPSPGSSEKLCPAS